MTTIFLTVCAFIAGAIIGAYANGHPAEVNAAGEAIKSRIGKLWDKLFHKEQT